MRRVFFADEETAIAVGYRPCATCMPDEYAAWKAATWKRGGVSRRGGGLCRRDPLGNRCVPAHAAFLEPLSINRNFDGKNLRDVCARGRNLLALRGVVRVCWTKMEAEAIGGAGSAEQGSRGCRLPAP